MLYFRQVLLNHIKVAANEKEIETVIDESIRRLKTKNMNGHLIQRFILAMGQAISQAKMQDAASGVQGKNMDFALAVFRRLHKP
jgi:hypothetical protein